MLDFVLAAALAAGTAAPVAQVEFNYACNDAAKGLLAKGLEAADNIRNDEARGLYGQAAAADPKCVDAKILAAQLTSGPELKKVMEEVDKTAAGLPEPEKTLVAIIDAQRDAHPEKALEL